MGAITQVWNIIINYLNSEYFYYRHHIAPCTHRLQTLPCSQVNSVHRQQIQKNKSQLNKFRTFTGEYLWGSECATAEVKENLRVLLDHSVRAIQRIPSGFPYCRRLTWNYLPQLVSRQSSYR